MMAYHKYCMKCGQFIQVENNLYFDQDMNPITHCPGCGVFLNDETVDFNEFQRSRLARAYTILIEIAEAAENAKQDRAE